MYMLGVFVHANPVSGQPTQLARDLKFWWALTSRLFFFGIHTASAPIIAGTQLCLFSFILLYFVFFMLIFFPFSGSHI